MPPQFPADSNGAAMLAKVGRARRVVIVEQAPAPRLAGNVGARFRQFLLGQRARAGDELARDHASGAAFADAVLHARDLARIPARQEVGENAAMTAQLAVIVGRAFPDAQRGEMRRIERRDLPLVHGVVGDAVDADLAVAPGLRAGPLDARIEILRLARRPHVEMAGRTPGAARVDAHAGIAVRHPFLRIDQFPVLIFVARALQHLGRGLGQARPVALVAFLERQPLGVGPVAENDRMLPRPRRPEHVGAQDDAVIHGNRRVPIDLHAAGLPLVSSTSRPYRYLRLALKTHLGPVANESTSSGSRKSPVFLGLVKYEQGQRIKS